MTGLAAAELLDARRAVRAPGLLRAFNDAGVLAAADVHVARRLAALAGEEDEAVGLAAALAVRGPRLGHVCVDLDTIRATATVDTEQEVDLGALPWPEPAEWRAKLDSSRLVARERSPAGDARPLRLAGSLLYLDRYWREEGDVAADLRGLATPAPGVDAGLLRLGIDRLFGAEAGARQALAAAAAVLSRFAVVAGGPGTGKTTTVARIVALLAEQAAAASAPEPLVALAAPTGKAAARLEEAVRHEAAALAVDDAVRALLHGLGASTLHRLLGWRPGSHSRFRHDRQNRLPHDVVIVDETSMVSLSLMARLVEAVRPDARLVLVGDPGQLTSIEAGAVLGDVVGPATESLRMSAAARERLAAATGHGVAGATAGEQAGLGDGIVVLERVHRFHGAIAELAEAIRRGDADATLATLSAGDPAVIWLPIDAGEAPPEQLAPLRERAVPAARAVVEAAREGRAADALAALGAFRVLCAHRRGAYGAETWMSQIEAWLIEAIPGFATEGQWYAGRPLLVTENDYGLRLYNGDTGVVIASAGGRPSAVFERGGELVELSPARLGAIDTVYAMTVHKSQGSQFDRVAVVLPGAGSPVLSRELLYTAVTRARSGLVLAGTEETVRAAVDRPVARASGLRARLWTPADPG